MATTYEPIATTTLTSAQATVTFSNIPSTYTDLILVSNYLGSTSDGFWTRINGDSGSNYSRTVLFGRTTVTGSTQQTSTNNIILGPQNGYFSATEPAPVILQYMNYKNTNVFKTVLGRCNLANNEVQAIAGTWRNLNAITSITIYGDGSQGTVIGSGSTFTLYGIAAA